MRLAFVAIFFASGLAALVYQVSWQRVLSQMVGIDAYSVTMIVSIFMLGLGIGGIVGGAIASSGQNLLRAFVAAEVLIGAFGFFSPMLIRALNRSDAVVLSGLPVEFAANFLLLLAPTLLMGVSLPLLVQLFRSLYSTGAALGVLYTANILGAASGAALCGFVLIGTLGVDGTCRLMVLINLLVAASTTALATRTDAMSRAGLVQLPSSGTTDGRPAVAYPLISFLSVLSGFAALSYEIIYFRIFSTYFGLTGYVFAILLTTYLLCLALGNRIFGSRADREDPLKLMIIGSVGATVATLPVLYLQGWLSDVGIDPARYFVVLQMMRPQLLVQLIGITCLATALLLPVVFISVYFPVLARLSTPSDQRSGSAVGAVYFTQTIGNTLGVLVTGLVLLPTIGTIWSLRAIACLLASLPLVYAVVSSRRLPSATRAQPARGLWLVATCIAAGLLYPTDFYNSIRIARVEAPERVMETALGVSLVYREPGVLRVTVGREGTAAFATDQNTVLCSPHELASLFTPTVKRALIIGVGTGALPVCLQYMYPGVHVDIVELNPSLIELMREQGDPQIRRSLELASVYVTDGRRFVNKHPDLRYDFIQVGVYHVTASGAGGLFTREFQGQLRAMLTDDGVLTYNAYPPAIQASLELFKTVVVVGHDSMIGTIFASNSPERPTTGTILSTLPASAFVDGAAVGQRDYWSGACLYSRDDVERLVRGVDAQSDGLPVTEFFITQRQNIVGQSAEQDLRRWGCLPGSSRLTALSP